MEEVTIGGIVSLLLIGLIFTRTSASILFLTAALACLFTGLVDMASFWGKSDE
jgi:hypothetical protein